MKNGEPKKNTRMPGNAENWHRLPNRCALLCGSSEKEAERERRRCGMSGELFALGWVVVYGAESLSTQIKRNSKVISLPENDIYTNAGPQWTAVDGRTKGGFASRDGEIEAGDRGANKGC